MKKCKHEYRIYRNKNFINSGLFSYYCVNCLKFFKKKLPTIEESEEVKN